MAKINYPHTEESEVYENLLGQSLLLDSDQPEKPNLDGSPYPFTLKVHTWTRGDTEKFAEKIKQHLSSEVSGRNFIYKKGSATRKNATWSYTEKRGALFLKSQSHQRRIESELWKNTLEFHQDGWDPYITFEVLFETPDDYIDFSRLIQHALTLNTKSINFPQKKPRVYKYGWRSTWSDHNPRYPIYIVSKGRGDSRLTSRALERMNVPYYIVIEPQDYDEYACVIDPQKILVLPFSNHGDGPGRARNWCWDHSKALGFKRHWVMDDNIKGFLRLHRNRRHPVLDGGMFRVCEEFVDRFKNVPLAGLQYRFFCTEKTPYPPFGLNTRIYSCLLIENSCPYRWRGRYNEDTILSLDILKAGMCTMQFNNLLQEKIGTQVLKGGNTDEFYGKEGTYNKSKMLEDAHPDVAKVVWRYGRYHHHVDYEPFKANQPVYRDGYTPEANAKETDSFGLIRVKTN